MFYWQFLFILITPFRGGSHLKGKVHVSLSVWHGIALRTTKRGNLLLNKHFGVKSHLFCSSGLIVVSQLVSMWKTWFYFIFLVSVKLLKSNIHSKNCVRRSLTVDQSWDFYDLVLVCQTPHQPWNNRSAGIVLVLPGSHLMPAKCAVDQQEVL